MDAHAASLAETNSAAFLLLPDLSDNHYRTTSVTQKLTTVTAEELTLGCPRLLR